MTRLRVVLAVVIVFVCATVARAQDARPPNSTTEEQKRFAAGLAFGIGSVSFHPTTVAAPATESYAGVGVTLWGAWRFSDRFGVFVDSNIVDRSGAEHTAGTILIGLQYWATPKLWLKGGAGWGVLNSADTEQLPVDEYGPAFGASAGTELTRLRRLGVDVDAQIRFTQSHARKVRARSIAAQLGIAKRFGASPIATTTPPPTPRAPETGQNLFGLELIGRSGLAGFVYERELSARVAAGVGVGLGWDIVLENSPGLIPVFMSWSPVGETHRLYTGAGLGLVHVSSAFRGYFMNFEPRIGWSAYRTGTVAYEHRARNNDGFWRLGLNIWYQPYGIPGGLLNTEDSGFAFVPAFSFVGRF